MNIIRCLVVWSLVALMASEAFSQMPKKDPLKSEVRFTLQTWREIDHEISEHSDFETWFKRFYVKSRRITGRSIRWIVSHRFDERTRAGILKFLTDALADEVGYEFLARASTGDRSFEVQGAALWAIGAGLRLDKLRNVRPAIIRDVSRILFRSSRRVVSEKLRGIIQWNAVIILGEIDTRESAAVLTRVMEGDFRFGIASFAAKRLLENSAEGGKVKVRATVREWRETTNRIERDLGSGGPPPEKVQPPP